jgi:hypothetical protein
MNSLCQILMLEFSCITRWQQNLIGLKMCLVGAIIINYNINFRIHKQGFNTGACEHKFHTPRIKRLCILMHALTPTFMRAQTKGRFTQCKHASPMQAPAFPPSLSTRCWNEQPSPYLAKTCTWARLVLHKPTCPDSIARGSHAFTCT